MIIPEKLKKGDLIGVVAPSNPIIGDNIEEIQKAKEIIENLGFKVKFATNLFSNTNKYSASAREKAQDINEMFRDSNVKMIWCSKGGENSKSIFEYLDFNLIKQNPKIICGYSDITSLTNIITERTGLITYSSTNFKTIATDETDYSLKQVLSRFVDGSLQLGEPTDYIIIQKGICEGKLVGGNLSLTRALSVGNYNIDFTDKILFLEELGFETEPALVSNYLYYMKQNNIFKKVKGIWLGNYTHESQITLEQILLDTIYNEFEGPIIKSNNFGHIEKKIVIPIGINVKIDTSSDLTIRLLENCVK